MENEAKAEGTVEAKAEGTAAKAEGTAAKAEEAVEAKTGETLEEQIVEALRTVYDPEIPVNIYEMGLIYDLDIAEEGDVKVTMTLTSPACPVAGSLPGEVQEKVAGVPGVRSADVDLVWDPAWNPSMMSEAAQLELGFM